MEVPEYFVGACYFGSGGDHFSPEKRHSDQKPTAGGETFAVDDLLDFSHADAIISSDNTAFLDNVAAGNSTDNNSSTATAAAAVDSCNSSNNRNFSSNFAPHQLPGELCVPYDDMAELEWLSNFVEDSFTGQDELKTLHLLSGSTAAAGSASSSAFGAKPQTPESSSSSETLPPFDAASRNAPFLRTETPLPGKARSKRSRAAPGDWSTRFLHLVTAPAPPHAAEGKPAKAAGKRREGSNNNNNSNNDNPDSTGRRCLHCGAEKTPQWRTGPMGPKTLCNACGVRYKSGRLVPEYRPAASPTFMSTKHSNSHRKVLELRRQKDLQRQQHQQLMSQASIFGVSNGGDHEFLIHHHHGGGGGPDYRHIM